MDFTETAEQKALRAAVADLANHYGYDYSRQKARTHEPLTELWAEAGRLGFLGVNLPEEFGGGGAGLFELSLVLEELAATGSWLLMMLVSPAICGTVISRYGTAGQKERFLPGLADGSSIMAFAITEPDAGSNSHRLSTTARRSGDGEDADWIISGRKIYISGVDQAEHVLVVGRASDGRTDGAPSDRTLKPALFAVPTNAAGVTFHPIEMDVVMPDRQFLLFLDDVRVPADALIGAQDAALAQLFAGLNPERIMAAALSVGMGRYALGRATRYAREREVFGAPIGTHQGVSHPLAQIKVELELARLMMQKAATLCDAGDDLAAGEAANMAKYAAAEAATRAVDQAVQTLGGNGLAAEYGLGSLLAAVRALRIAPVSREMILNFVAQFSLGLPKSY